MSAHVFEELVYQRKKGDKEVVCNYHRVRKDFYLVRSIFLNRMKETFEYVL